uniref:asparaginase n=1 Tax=Rhizochromulina marina TaxID=1034831 RepID=A0A7S2WSI2_9STRA
MEPNAEGALVPVRGSVSKQMASMQELHSHPEMPNYDIIEYDPLLDSADMSPEDWVRIAEDIETHYFQYDGFVVICGTDTMAYAASALSFMLENLAKPVIFTGSQIPFHEVYNDARKNLIVSMIFASRDDFLEVCVYFHDRLLRGNRASKINSFRVDAFDSPNFPRLAEVGVNITARFDLAMRLPRGSFRVHKEMNTNIVVIKLVPGYDDDCISHIVNDIQSLRALVLEIYGTGNAPARKSGLLNAIRTATSRGIVVIAATQCRTGGVILDKYAVGVALRDAGVIPAGDMTIEACATKLSYLLERTDGSPETIRRLMQTDLRGELSPESALRRSIFTACNALSPRL